MASHHDLRPIVRDRARCPQCRQVMSYSDWSDDVGLDVVQCETRGCPTAGAGESPLVLFTIEEHFEDWSWKDYASDVVAEEPIPYATVDEDGRVELLADARAEQAAFRLAFPELSGGQP